MAGIRIHLGCSDAKFAASLLISVSAKLKSTDSHALQIFLSQVTYCFRYSLIISTLRELKRLIECDELLYFFFMARIS